MNTPSQQEKKIHLVFEVTLLLKGLNAITEILGGVAVFFISKAYIVSTVLYFTQEELSEDPKDVIAHYIMSTSNNFSITTQHFVALYLVSHGIIKLFLVIGLLRKKLFVYPLSIVVFGMFIVYQLYRYSYTFSVWLLLLTVFDIVIIWLTAHEYRYLKKYNLSR
jgi:uncharacterized membrane protein